jgi:putative FmdB family regulatory protein
MPIYEYLCEKCDHEFEREQRMSDPPVRTCPRCRSRRVKRLISRTAFHLKGGGWYKDLYSSAKPGEKKGEGAPSESKEKKSADKSGGDSKSSDKKGGSDAKARAAA